MSYRPESQSLEDPARDMVRAIDRFCDAVDERANSGDWEVTHISELVSLVSRVTPLKYDLIKLARETW